MGRREMLKSGAAAAVAGFVPLAGVVDGLPAKAEINKSLRTLAIIGDVTISKETLHKISTHLESVTDDEWLVVTLPDGVDVKEIQSLEVDGVAHNTSPEE